jgi:AraC-like DNA-binding protein
MIAQRESAEDLSSPRGPRVAARQNTLLAQRAIEYIEANYLAPISLRDVAQALGYSRCHLTHAFRESTGTPITAWIIKRRIVAAQRLLAESQTNVAEAAEAVGFNDLCYFTRQFVRHVGVTPGRFRAIMNADSGSGEGGGPRMPLLKGIRG